ncbi:Zinc finger protein 36, C3H1 type-like 1 [Zancudomyces culisetae]|uniref:Zinc finger protein 36, C3H1 type-like 1 n=1 Tax=Zancudomyces culisetae TaxID=1213189 RepID=A0A1R1PRH0_ZANCU|nr:Zinc finger protein 36, C3H1 type-like 1 [Zancudomyces culisetae]|eukprot:OMH83541.1 Zinc finger protein 36, C3H1 type-like 1 [Zancudomyces culisetae]
MPSDVFNEPECNKPNGYLNSVSSRVDLKGNVDSNNNRDNSGVKVINKNKGKKKNSMNQAATDRVTLRKTELCTNFKKYGLCEYGDDCDFAHGNRELVFRARHPLFRTVVCQKWIKYGSCRYNDRCNFLHPSYGNNENMILKDPKDTSKSRIKNTDSFQNNNKTCYTDNENNKGDRFEKEKERVKEKENGKEKPKVKNFKSKGKGYDKGVWRDKTVVSIKTLKSFEKIEKECETESQNPAIKSKSTEDSPESRNNFYETSTPIATIYSKKSMERSDARGEGLASKCWNMDINARDTQLNCRTQILNSKVYQDKYDGFSIMDSVFAGEHRKWYFPQSSLDQRLDILTRGMDTDLLFHLQRKQSIGTRSKGFFPPGFSGIYDW